MDQEKEGIKMNKENIEKHFSPMAWLDEEIARNQASPGRNERSDRYYAAGKYNMIHARHEDWKVPDHALVAQGVVLSCVALLDRGVDGNVHRLFSEEELMHPVPDDQLAVVRAMHNNYRLRIDAAGVGDIALSAQNDFV